MYEERLLNQSKINSELDNKAEQLLYLHILQKTFLINFSCYNCINEFISNEYYYTVILKSRWHLDTLLGIFLCFPLGHWLYNISAQYCTKLLLLTTCIKAYKFDIICSSRAYLKGTVM